MNDNQNNQDFGGMPIQAVVLFVCIALGMILLMPQASNVVAQVNIDHPYPALEPLDPPPIPADNTMSDARVELGRMLFFDPRMSSNSTISCASCHNPNLGWGNGTPISFGYTSTLHWRNSPTIVNSAYYTHLNWAGAAKSLENQAKGAWKGAVAGNMNTLMAEERLAQIPEYIAMFEDAYGTEPLWDNMLRAIGVFERTIVTDSEQVPFDRWSNGDASAVSEEALTGYELFAGKAGCIQCHNGALISDQNFYNTGVPQPEAWANNPTQQITFRYEQWAKGAPEAYYFGATEDYGLFYTTHEEDHIGHFRTPSLRELTYTAPYMHNGVFNTLEEVVQFYNAGGGDHPNQDERLVPLDLNDEEVAAIVVFLQSLSSDELVSVDPPTLPEYAVYNE